MSGLRPFLSIGPAPAILTGVVAMRRTLARRPLASGFLRVKSRVRYAWPAELLPRRRPISERRRIAAKASAAPRVWVLMRIAIGTLACAPIGRVEGWESLLPVECLSPSPQSIMGWRVGRNGSARAAAAA